MVPSLTIICVVLGEICNHSELGILPLILVFILHLLNVGEFQQEKI